MRARSPAESRDRALPRCGRPSVGGKTKDPLPPRRAARGRSLLPAFRRPMSGTAHKRREAQSHFLPGEGATMPPRTAPHHTAPAAGCHLRGGGELRGPRAPPPGLPVPLPTAPRLSAGPAARSLIAAAARPGTCQRLPAHDSSPAEWLHSPLAHCTGEEGFKPTPKPFPPPFCLR